MERPSKRQRTSEGPEPPARRHKSAAYATPEPSHASDRGKLDGQSRSSHGDAVPRRSSTSPPPSDLSKVLGRSGPGPLSKSAVEAVCVHNHISLKKATNLSVGQALQKARQNAPQAGTASQAALNVFRGLGHLQLKPREIKPAQKRGVHIRAETYRPGATKKSKKLKVKVKNCVTVPATVPKILVQPEPVPQYSWFVRLKDNMLAPNVKMLFTWPYHGDEYQPQVEDYKGFYSIDVPDRKEKIRRLHNAAWLFQAAESAVDELGISWQDVLVFFFGPLEKLDDAKIATLLEKRSKLADEECPLASPHWIELAEKFMSDVDLDRLIKAAYFCEHFGRVSSLSAWQVLRRCALVREHFSDDDPESEAHLIDLQDEACRICHRFRCHGHGELLEDDPADEAAPDDAKSSSSSEDEDASDIEISPTEDKVARDVVNPPQINFRKAIKYLSPSRRALTSAGDERKRSTYWDRFDKPAEYALIYPCDHPGRPCDKRCPCFKAQIPCSKQCSCPGDCERKFQGCLCSMKHGRFVCFKDDRCACYQMGRECDPDLCGECGICDVLTQPESLSQGRCRNANLQAGRGKHTILGRSHVHEYGLYACEPMKPHDFIGEYKGELITKDEANRRGAIYEPQHMSYLFSLNSDQEVDSTFQGNKMRFINHSLGQSRNVYALITMTNSVHRIALFADRHIEPGEELFFDYGPSFPSEQVGGKVVRKSVPKARNAKLLKEFKEPKGTKINAKTRSRKPTVTTRHGTPEEESDESDSSGDESNFPEFGLDGTNEDPSNLPEDRLAAYNISASVADPSEDESRKGTRKKRARR